MNDTRSIPPLPDPADAPLKTRLARAAAALAVFLLIMYVLAPLPIKYFAPMRQYADVVDRTGIVPGALFYNDVPQTYEAEVSNRASIRYFAPKRLAEEKAPARR